MQFLRSLQHRNILNFIIAYFSFGLILQPWFLPFRFLMFQSKFVEFFSWTEWRSCGIKYLFLDYLEKNGNLIKYFCDFISFCLGQEFSYKYFCKFFILQLDYNDTNIYEGRNFTLSSSTTCRLTVTQLILYNLAKFAHFKHMK